MVTEVSIIVRLWQSVHHSVPSSAPLRKRLNVREWDCRAVHEKAALCVTRWLLGPTARHVFSIINYYFGGYYFARTTSHYFRAGNARAVSNGSTRMKSTQHVSSVISVNPRTSTTSCAGVPTRRLKTPESASYRDSSSYSTLHWVLRDSTNNPSTMRSSNLF